MTAADEKYWQKIREEKAAQAARTPQEFRQELEKLQPPQPDPSKPNQPQWLKNLRKDGVSI